MVHQPTFWNAAGEIVTSTRAAAAASIAPLAGGQRRRVFEYLVERGALGATDEEIALALGLKDSTARARRVELRDAGHVVAAGVRKTQSGRAATVWMATR